MYIKSYCIKIKKANVFVDPLDIMCYTWNLKYILKGKKKIRLQKKHWLVKQDHHNHCHVILAYTSLTAWEVETTTSSSTLNSSSKGSNYIDKNTRQL
jgi:hypothetical protein